MRQFSFRSAHNEQSTAITSNSLAEYLSFLDVITSGESGALINDDRVQVLVRLLRQFDPSLPAKQQCQLLIRIRWYAGLVNYKPLVRQVDRCVQPLLTHSLDRNDQHAVLLLANSPLNDVVAVSNGEFATYKHDMDALIKAMRRCGISKKDPVGVTVYTIKKSLAALAQAYANDMVNFNTLAAIDISVNLNTMLDSVLHRFVEIPLAQHKEWWQLIDMIATTMSKAQHYYKLPQHKDSLHRRYVLVRKDSLNAIKDSASLVDKLQRSYLLQQIFLLLDRLYKVRRLLEWSDSVDDIAWLGTLIQRVGAAYTHVCEMIESLMMHNPSPSHQEVGIIISLFSVRQALATGPFAYLNHVKVKQPNLSDQYAAKLRKDDMWQLTYLDALKQALLQASGMYPGLRINLLGGTEPLVFQVQCRGKTDKGMVLRLSMLGTAPDNQAAIDYLNANHPAILGDVYQEFEGVGDLIQAGSCAEFFPNGTLENFISKIHRQNPSRDFSRQQQCQIFSHVTQMLGLVMACHKAHIIFPDIKPANFLFATNPDEDIYAQLVVSDLKSLRKLPPGQWRTMDVAYTYAYKAPEVKVTDSGMLIDPVDPRAQDIYALGVTVREYLTGSNELAICFKPHNQFEQVIDELIKGLTQSDPTERLAFAEKAYTEMDVWYRRALSNRISRVASHAALFAQAVSRRMKSRFSDESPRDDVVNRR